MTKQTPEKAVDEIQDIAGVPFGTTMRRTLETLIVVLDNRYEEK